MHNSRFAGIQNMDDAWALTYYRNLVLVVLINHSLKHWFLLFWLKKTHKVVWIPQIKNSHISVLSTRYQRVVIRAPEINRAYRAVIMSLDLSCDTLVLYIVKSYYLTDTTRANLWVVGAWPVKRSYCTHVDVAFIQKLISQLYRIPNQVYLCIVPDMPNLYWFWRTSKHWSRELWRAPE